MFLSRVAAGAILLSLTVPAGILLVEHRAHLRSAMRGLMRQWQLAVRAAFLLWVLLASAVAPAISGISPAFAQTNVGIGSTPTATPTAKSTSSVTTATSTSTREGKQTGTTAEAGLSLTYGPKEPYYSDVLAQWKKDGYKDATQSIAIPVLGYSESSGGSYCEGPSQAERAVEQATGTKLAQAAQTPCVPAQPGTAQLPVALLQANPELGNVTMCTRDISAQSAKQGYCVATVGGKQNVLLWNNEDGSLTWKFNVRQAGLYSLQVTYYPVPGKGASIGREVLIDGKYPYLEAHRIAFSRVWVNAGPVTVDNQGNDIRPPVKEKRYWRTVFANDSLGMTRNPLDFYLSPGEHTLTLHAIREPIAIGALAFVPPLEQPTYTQALAKWQSEGLQPVHNVVLNIQAEDAVARNDPTIRDESSSDPFSEPYSFGHFRLNTYGGQRWRSGGQWIEWRFAVPQNGLYELTFRVNQAGLGHMRVYRDIQIDDKFQYQQLKEFPINFSLFWENVCVCNDQGQPYLVHLTKGVHVLKMTDRVGPISQTVQDLQTVVAELGYWQRRIELITGPNPDPNLEYNLDQKMPDMLPAFRDMVAKLNNNIALLTKLNLGQMPDTANSLVTVRDFLKRLINRPDVIASNVTNLDSYSQQLATWLLNVQQEPVWMDRFYVAGPSFQVPPAEAPLWEQAIFTVRDFFGSFIFNYTGIGSIYTPTPGHPVIDVWTARGQEWAMILKEMIESNFTPKTGIYVNLHVFPPGTLGGAQSVLLLALTSGAAPDVATGVDANTPVEFAIRGAIYPLDTLPGFKDVAQQFLPGALVQFKYPSSGPNSHIYALPETQNFNMLFVRTDILKALHMQPPQTWEEVYNMMPTLQENGMEFYYSTSADIQTGGFSPFLFQHGGAYYTTDGLRSALDTPQALSAFKQWTGLYTDYRVPVQANFYNRFRTGEMPVGVADYNTYIALSVAAPELIGRWRMLPMPGTPRGNIIDRSAGGSGETVLMFQKTQHKREAWQYIKWWLSAPTQEEYANEIEALLGVSARWNTSNVDALRSLPWPQQDIRAILDQWQWFREQPVVLGGYYTPRYLANAWNEVVLSGANPREALLQAVRNINREMERKQVEFNVKVPKPGQPVAQSGGTAQ
ncbi:MAG: extracellular solute-binding protein [Chloroflexi bacterium]|nr:extracellular solute-binding protein [Chloroflexota bacterium]